VLKTQRKMGIASVAVYSDADRFTAAPMEADEARLRASGPARARPESYLDIDAVIAACKATGAEAVHPGLRVSQRDIIEFARRLAEAGIAFIGPRPQQIEAFGLKHTAA